MNKLWVVGDSFSRSADDDSKKDWPNIVADRLNLELYNKSELGTSQDWAFELIQLHRNDITQDDQIILALTDPARFYFSQEYPNFSYVNIVGLQNYLPGGLHHAIEQYLKYIQRPQLDIQWTAQRLAWLNNLVTIKNWRKPLILLCVPQVLANLDD